MQISRANDAWKREAAARHDADLLRYLPSRPARGGGASRPVGRIVSINPLNSLPVLGCNYAITKPASIPDYNPDLNPATVDGIGIAQMIDTGEMVLFANYAAGTTVGVARDWPLGNSILFGGTDTILISGSSPAAYKTLQIPGAWFGG